MACAMTTPHGVFHQQDFTAAQCSAAAIGDFQLDCTIEQHDELTLGGVVPVVVVTGIVLSEDHRLRRDWPREPADLASSNQFDLDIREVCFAVVVSKDSSHLHARGSCPRATTRCKSD